MRRPEWIAETDPSKINSIGWDCRISRLHLFKGVRLSPQMGSPVSRGWRAVMLNDAILVAEQYMTCKTSLWSFLKIDVQSERPPPINRMVTSNPSTCMIVPTVYLNCSYGKLSTPFLLYVLECGG